MLNFRFPTYKMRNVFVHVYPSSLDGSVSKVLTGNWNRCFWRWRCFAFLFLVDFWAGCHVRVEYGDMCPNNRPIKLKIIWNLLL